MPSLSRAACPRQVHSAPPASSLQSPALRRRALTVIEMLIATAITLVMMAAVVNLFANLSNGIRNRRAVIEVSSHLRQVRQRLARDLAGCTVPLAPEGLVPWQRAGEAIGYFEIVEGEQSDSDPSDLLDDDDGDGYPDGIDVGSSLLPGSQLADVNNGYSTDARGLGDWDDILALTVRSDAEPFVGFCEEPDPAASAQPGYPDSTVNAHWRRAKVESNLAEVVWYAVEVADDPDTTNIDETFGREPGSRMLYRRVLLIAPWLRIRQRPSLTEFHAFNDIATHGEGTQLVPSTLADLTRREYRFGRSRVALFPFDFERARLQMPFAPPDDLPYDPRFLMLADALAFDVRVFDPGAPLLQVAASGTPVATDPIVQPSDAGWDRAFGASPLSYSITGFGAYVDLGWNNAGAYDYTSVTNAPPTHFQQQHEPGWHPTIPNLFRGQTPGYDTWSWHYENDRLDQETILTQNASLPPGTFAAWQTNTLDQGTNGIDDELPNGINGVDDVLERETSPPYNVPLRGVKVLLRLYERDARQVREASVTHSFVP